MATAKKTTTTEVQNTKLNVKAIRVSILGLTPFIANRLSEKARHELLMPRGKMDAAQKKGNLKHDPLAEYRAAPYRMEDDGAPTLLAVPGAAFKGAIASAALDISGATKAQIGRSTWVTGYNLPLFGVPQIFSAITRSSDMARTPDVRTRAILPHWCTEFSINYVEPTLRAQQVYDLILAAGLICGVGDWRQQKGSGSFGQFRVCEANDPEFLAVKKNGGRKQQEKAMIDPEAFDADTQELLGWFDVESRRRGFKTTTKADTEARVIQ